MHSQMRQFILVEMIILFYNNSNPRGFVSPNGEDNNVIVACVVVHEKYVFNVCSRQNARGNKNQQNVEQRKRFLTKTKKI